MKESGDNVDRELFRNMQKLRALRIEHRDLDEVISRLSLDIHIDELQLKRLKKVVKTAGEKVPYYRQKSG